jgi:hypothetical protein
VSRVLAWLKGGDIKAVGTIVDGRKTGLSGHHDRAQNRSSSGIEHEDGSGAVTLGRAPADGEDMVGPLAHHQRISTIGVGR